MILKFVQWFLFYQSAFKPLNLPIEWFKNLLSLLVLKASMFADTCD